MKDKIIAKLKEKEKILNKIIKHWQKFVHGDIRVDMWEIGLKQLESILERLESELAALESQEVKEITDEMIGRFMESVIALHPTFQIDDQKQEECYLAYHDIKNNLTK